MDIKQQFKLIQNNFTENKEFIIDGYYRIRTLDSETFELAFLVGGPCGETIVHPQITVKINENEVIGEKLIDMYTTPAKFFSREKNSLEINQALEELIEKFLKSKQLDGD
ncbi:hypothetical protein [Enterococcus rivorum]|uniref:hypothetical protein n=1 Tax=Enterococcus rivorum TaxID=762845 RepID=UPI000A048EF0|nr:hypothetical protein [Enterococcus rivorum]MBP2097722.1 hypothetical protein [Enterococcus rivorum]